MYEGSVARERRIQRRERAVLEPGVLAQVLSDKFWRIDESLRKTVESNAVRNRRRKRADQKPVYENQAGAVAEEERPN